MHTMLLLAVAVGLALAGGTAPAQATDKKAGAESPYRSLFRELRAADLIVKVRLTGSKTAGAWSDEAFGWSLAILDGTVTAVYQGKAEVDQPIRLVVDRVALARTQKKYKDTGSFFRLYEPPWKAGAVCVFLIRQGKPLQATALLADSGLVPEYVKISCLPDADATLGLVKLLCARAYDKAAADWYYYDFPHTLLNDLRVNYQHLQTNGKGFKSLLAARRPDTLRALRQSDSFGFNLAVYLTAHVDPVHRREALAVLLARFEENELLIAKLEKEEQALLKNQGQQGLYVSPLNRAHGTKGMLILGLEMIRDPAWTRDIATANDGSILPSLAQLNKRWDAAEVLAKVKAAVQK